jgi:hypothetical protein
MLGHCSSRRGAMRFSFIYLLFFWGGGVLILSICIEESQRLRASYISWIVGLHVE